VKYNEKLLEIEIEIEIEIEKDIELIFNSFLKHI
jgi:hypothetical protein